MPSYSKMTIAETLEFAKSFIEKAPPLVGIHPRIAHHTGITVTWHAAFGCEVMMSVQINISSDSAPRAQVNVNTPGMNRPAGQARAQVALYAAACDLGCVLQAMLDDIEEITA